MTTVKKIILLHCTDDEYFKSKQNKYFNTQNKGERHSLIGTGV